MRPLRIPSVVTAAISALLALTACSPSAGSADSGATQAMGQPAIGGPFQLTDQDGKPVDQTVLNGKWSAVFFGYTFCPDVCPTTLTTLGQAQTMLGPQAKDLQVVFITVDPARDTSAQLKSYLSSPVFPKGTKGLTGAPAQVDQAAKAYKVFYQKEGKGTDYVMDHTSLIYLMNRQGKFDRVLANDLKPAEITHQIRDAMSQGPKAGA